MPIRFRPRYQTGYNRFTVFSSPVPSKRKFLAVVSMSSLLALTDPLNLISTYVPVDLEELSVRRPQFLRRQVTRLHR
jgi:hypothetical protein